jgi:hypothetical protein
VVELSGFSGQLSVIPANTGIQPYVRQHEKTHVAATRFSLWIPAFAGMTGEKHDFSIFIASAAWRSRIYA